MVMGSVPFWHCPPTESIHAAVPCQTAAMTLFNLMKKEIGMQSVILGLLAETPIHPGSGRNLGVIDLPVAREAATQYPVLVGSSLKGALRDKCERGSRGDADLLFGKASQAGAVLVSDAKLVLLPIRSLTGQYKWLTCPYLIERLLRDLKRSGLSSEVFEGVRVPEIPHPQQALSDPGQGPLYLEEREFQLNGRPDGRLLELLGRLILHEASRTRLARQVTIVHDDAFAWFASYGLPIQARNVLNDETKQSENLWYEETVPSDSLFYTLLTGRNEAVLQDFLHIFSEDQPYLQAGGNETVGQGWFAVRTLKNEEAKA